MKAMVAQMAPEQTELVAASGHLARTGTIAGGIGAAVGGGLIALVGVEWLPVAGAVGFVGAAVLASRVFRPWSIEARVESVVIRVETPIEVRRAVPAVATIRAAEGALTFLLALSIKRGGGDEWIFVAALVAAGVGTFAGTIVSPRLYRAFSTDGIVVLTLLIPGAMSLFGVLTIGSLSIVAIALAIGLGGSVATRAMDAIYGGVPHLMRGRIISRSELLFQLANVTGAAIAVLVYPGPRVGFAAVAVVLTIGGLFYASQLRQSLRHEAGRWLLGQRPRAATDGLPLGLLAEAMRFHEQRDHYVAIVVADSAVRVLNAREPTPPDSTAQPAWEALGDTIAAVIGGRLDPTVDDARAVIDAAGAVIAERRIVGTGAVDITPQSELAGGHHDGFAFDDPSVADEAEVELHGLNSSSLSCTSTSMRTLSPSSTTGASRMRIPSSATTVVPSSLVTSASSRESMNLTVAKSCVDLISSA